MRPALVSVGTPSGYMGVLRHTDLTDVRPPAGTPIPARWPRLPERGALPPRPIRSAFLFSLTVAESDLQRRNKMNNKTPSSPLLGLFIFANMILAILAVPYFAAAMISGYIEYMDLKWVFFIALSDLLVLGVFSVRSDK